MLLNRDQTFKFVFNLRTQRASGGEILGSGIFLAKGEDLYLLTASHVAYETNSTTVLVIIDEKGTPTSMPLSMLSNTNSWKHHAVADIAILPIDKRAVVGDILIQRFFPIDHFQTHRSPVSRDIELTTVGFPHGLGVNGMFSPLTYRSYASSAIISFNRFDTKTPCEFFLLENPSVGGYSGGPVFDLGIMIVGAMTTTKDRTYCLGIIHGTISDETGGKLTAVTPTYYLHGFI